MGHLLRKDLPAYSQSLLRIPVSVVVTLAQKRQKFGRIVELGPGSILQFEKSCEEMLEVDVRGHPVAVGEAVKVGDKFGVRITSMVLPGERFEKVVPRRRRAGGG
jgi:flagellar motor switch/type III secretory pathway protein FliN